MKREMIFKDLNRGAFYRAFGYLPEYIYGNNALETQFRFIVPAWFLWYEKHIGLVKCSSLFKGRNELKRVSKKHFGLPARYSNIQKNSFILGDIARVSLFRK